MKTSKGFAPIIAIVIVLVVGLAASTAVYFTAREMATDTNKNTNQAVVNGNVNSNQNLNQNTNVNVNANTNSSSLSKATYTSQEFKLNFSYPSTWERQTLPQSGLQGNEQAGFTPKSVLDAYKSKYGHDSFWLTTFQVFNSNKTPKDWFNDNISPVSRTDVSESPINGYPAYYAKIVNESYTDHEYIISHSGEIIRFHMREKSINSYDYPQYVADFDSMVHSLQFTDETVGWKMYTNKIYNYSLKYPQDWTYEETNQSAAENQVMDKPAIYTTFYSQGKNYVFTFGIRRKGEDIMITGRTGTGAGDFVDGGLVKIGNASMQSGNLVYQDKVKTIFFPKEGSAEIDNYEIKGDFDSKLSYDTVDLTKTVEYSEVKTILSTFQFTK